MSVELQLYEMKLSLVEFQPPDARKINHSKSKSISLINSQICNIEIRHRRAITFFLQC